MIKALAMTAGWLLTSSTLIHYHYGDVIMGAITSQITSLPIVCSTVYSDADQRKHQSSASLAFVRGIHRGPVNSPHKWPVTRKIFPFDDVIMLTSIWNPIVEIRRSEDRLISIKGRRHLYIELAPKIGRWNQMPPHHKGSLLCRPSPIPPLHCRLTDTQLFWTPIMYRPASGPCQLQMSWHQMGIKLSVTTTLTTMVFH